MVNQDFETVLARYQQNLTEYKVSGNAALKSIVDVDRAWLDSYVVSLEQQSLQQQGFIQRFVSEYQTTNPDLVKMQGELKDIRAKAPVLQDAYETEKQAKEEEPMDYTPYYIKAGLIVGIGAVVALVGVFRPLYMR